MTESGVRKSEPRPVLRATRRQAQILDLAARGFADKQIADELRISVSTVRTQLQRFYRANDLHNRTEAVVFFREHRPKGVSGSG